MSKLKAKGGNFEGKGINQGINQGINFLGKVLTANLDKGINLNQPPNDDIYLSKKEAESLLGVSWIAIFKAVKRGKYKAIPVYGNGGLQYRIALSSLPSSAQVEWLRSHFPVEIPPEFLNRASEEFKREYARLITNVSKEDDIYMVETGGEIDKAEIRAYCVKQYLLNPCYKTVEELAQRFNIHPGTIYRWVNKAKESAKKQRYIEIESIKIPVRLPRTQVPEDVILASINIILGHQKIRIKQAYEYVLEQGYNISYSQYTRILNNMQPPIDKLIKYHRSGRVACLLDETPKIIRSWTKLPVMHTIVGDQHYLDFYFYSDELDDVVKITLYVWLDCTSRYIVSAVPALGNYTQWHVQASLVEACRIHIPNEIYTDWGKQENAKAMDELIQRLSQGSIHIGDFDKFKERYPDSKISRKRSTPFVPPVKPIEAGFRRFTEFLNQMGLPGYFKRDMSDPFRNKQIQDELKSLIKKRSLLSVEAGMEAIVKAVEKYNNTEMKTEEGKVFVPSELLWSGLEGRRVVYSDEDLAMLFYPRLIRKVRNASVVVTVSGKKVIFTAPELAWLTGEEVMILLNPFPPHEGSMILMQKGDDWEYLCRATPWIGYGVHPHDQERLSQAMEIKYRYLKQFVEALRKIHQHRPASIQKIGEISKITKDVKKQGEIVLLPLVRKEKDKNWDALGRLAEIYGYK